MPKVDNAHKHTNLTWDTHTCTHTHTHKHKHAYTLTHIYIPLYISLYVFFHTYTHTCAQALTYTRMFGMHVHVEGAPTKEQTAQGLKASLSAASSSSNLTGGGFGKNSSQGNLSGNQFGKNGSHGDLSDNVAGEKSSTQTNDGDGRTRLSEEESVCATQRQSGSGIQGASESGSLTLQCFTEVCGNVGGCGCGCACLHVCGLCVCVCVCVRAIVLPES